MIYNMLPSFIQLRTAIIKIINTHHVFSIADNQRSTAATWVKAWRFPKIQV